MIHISRTPDDIMIITQQEITGDATVRFEEADGGMSVFLSAQEVQPRFVMLRWNERTTEPVRVLGDTWERAYANLTWKSLDGERFMPWYFLASNGQSTVGCGVKTQPGSFVSFEYDASGVSCWFDVRCGDQGVKLQGRELCMGTLVCREYDGISSFEAACRFCKELCPNPIFPKEPVYGGNNWYYAYGQSSAEEIYEDSRLIAGLAQGNEVRPFMIIDDCWSPVRCAGPWQPNEKFGDMSQVARKMKDIGVRPGIWIRLLHDVLAEQAHPEWLLCGEYLDPSLPQVQEYLRATIAQVKSWGFELLKHDFSTLDMFGTFGRDLNGTITQRENWSFSDQTKTSAEIVLDFYRLIREACGDMIVIGCNTISHLCAGLVEINRTGDDTSGMSWNRTRAMGVNTLAFRMPHNGAFYTTDADCVGIIPQQIDWKLNREWLRLLAQSGTPLFISCANHVLDEAQWAEMKEAFRLASRQTDQAIPLDWEYNNEPQQWLINGQEQSFDFVQNSYPLLLEEWI